MSSDAKASTAGSNQRNARRLVLPAVVLALALALAVGSASGATTRLFVEVFGSAAEPAFPADRGLAFDQGAEELYAIDSTDDVLYRFNADGSASNFGALGSNQIDGEGAEDETAHGHLAFSSNDEREQVAIDESGEATDGNVYVTQSSSDVIDIFSEAGEYLGELSESTAGGAFGEPCGVAVDAEGTIYVGDRGDDMVHVFDPAAAVPVNGDNTASFATVSNPCAIAAGAGETAGFLFVNESSGAAHKLDATTGEVKYEIASSVNTLSVDPTSGHVFLTRNCCASSAVEEYDASEAAEASLVSSFKPGSTAEGVAVNGAAEEVFVARSSTENVEVYGAPTIVPDVETEAPTANTGTRATLAGTVNPDGVELDECFFEWVQFQSPFIPSEYDHVVPCAETPAEIGAGTSPVAVHADLTGLAPQNARYHYRLVAKNPGATVNGADEDFFTPSTVTAEAATGITPTEATLNGSVNPDTETISECVFEWGEKPGLNEPRQQFSEAVPCVPGPGGIMGESPVAVSATIAGLHPGTVYEYRLRTEYPTGPITTDAVLLQTAGPMIAGSWSESVTRTEATLKAQINPQGQATTYRFEYGKTDAYGSETGEPAVGADSEVHEVTSFLDGLEPGTTYHYRAIATNGIAENVGPDLTFVTYEPVVADTDCPNQQFRTGASGALPDCRAYEMVSPIDKAGADIAVLTDLAGNKLRLAQASLAGNELAYTSYRAFGDSPSAEYSSQYLASRGSGGWSSHGVSAPQGESILGPLTTPAFKFFFEAFSPDLSSAWFYDENLTPLTAEGAEGSVNRYRRDNTNDTYHFLIDDPAEIKGFSKNDSHVALIAPRVSPSLIYDYFDGSLQLVSVMNDGTPFSGKVGSSSNVLSHLPEWRTANVYRAVSEDGSRIFWTEGNKGTGGSGPVYVRKNPAEAQSAMSGEECTEPDKACTVPVSGSVTAKGAYFLTASADGERVLFGVEPDGSDGLQDLYEFDLATETPTLIAHNTTGVPETTNDFTHIYFDSTDALAPGAIAGEHNLYLSEEGAVSFIATLALIDIAGEGATSGLGLGAIGEETIDGVPAVSGYAVLAPQSALRASRASVDGRRFAFQSVRRLAGYDNTDARNGEPDVEVYVYDADSGELSCVSCSPSGARPVGMPLQKPFKSSDQPVGNNFGARRWAAAWLPTWERSLYASRAFSANGDRLFFNAFDPLVSQDTNGVQDVYEWEALDSGSCTEASSSFSEVNDGCVSLISSGESPQNSEFLDASPDGRDVFFETKSSLVSQDPGLIDIYDARTGGGYPQRVERPQCVGDACQSAPEPPNDPTPASAGFRGAGNPVARRNCATAARRAAKLSRRAKALRRKAKHSRSAKRSRALAKRSARFARRAKGLSRSATRCRRANRRASR